MSQLERAIAAANERKLASVGAEANDANPGIVFTDGELQDRSIFSGFDIEYDELVGTSEAISDFYMRAASTLGLRSLFVSSWCDGLLTGLLLASLPRED